MGRMVKVFLKPVHDCAALGKKISIMQLRVYREEFACRCEHCKELLAQFEQRDGFDDVPDDV